MMRISSRATNCSKDVYFCSAVLEKLASKLALVLAPEEVDTSVDTVLSPWNFELCFGKLVFWTARFTQIPNMYTLYIIFCGLGVQF